ncbi:hypothetical protein HanRHA438_Chr10g0432751 [Helianthus annuus]|nr:hypothetical protein HanRHA438_Chr10g0432711 [Helianthus annuus]KAJ0877816.1 hypothetical protein HanRHA438_Chr10g0432751 [Helianthus annuus]
MCQMLVLLLIINMQIKVVLCVTFTCVHCVMYMYLLVTRFVSYCFMWIHWLTGSPRPWVELGIATIT